LLAAKPTNPKREKITARITIIVKVGRKEVCMIGHICVFAPLPYSYFLEWMKREITCMNHSFILSLLSIPPGRINSFKEHQKSQPSSPIPIPHHHQHRTFL
jgi:hypothetical protein